MDQPVPPGNIPDPNTPEWFSTVTIVVELSPTDASQFFRMGKP